MVFDRGLESIGNYERYYEFKLVGNFCTGLHLSGPRYDTTDGLKAGMVGHVWKDSQYTSL
jgi:hypothetical protein